jgi:hypothetical protein
MRVVHIVDGHIVYESYKVLNDGSNRCADVIMCTWACGEK